MERVILHSDANSFYASVACVDNPQLRHKPVAVCGDPLARHGIVLAATREAKNYGVKTGMAVWQARSSCPGLIVVPPNYERYIHFSKMLREMYCEYTDRVESYGLDECWLDLTNPGFTIWDGAIEADKLRARVKDELGITVSIGVSWCKIMAKLGSDYHKPDAVTVVDPGRFREMIWCLPVSDLLFVGPQTAKKLCKIGINTIGDLALAPTTVLQHMLGRNGLILQAYANGWDTSPVMPVTVEAAIKSVGNSITTPCDIATPEDARCVYYLLSESVGARLREYGYRSKCVSISLRTTNLLTHSCQRTLLTPTNISKEIAEAACNLFETRYQYLLPLRSVGVSCSKLITDTSPVQLDMLGVQDEREKLERLDAALDGIRNRFGNRIIQRGNILTNSAFAGIDPKGEHVIHPESFFRG